MLEIFAIILLSNKNKANAIARGRKPGGFVALTIGLWLGLEILGAIIGGAAGLGIGAYGLALVLAGIGALISYLAAKNCTPGEYVPPAQAMTQAILGNTKIFEKPVCVDIVREGSMVGAIVNWSFSLNGQDIGTLGNGKSMTVFTYQRQNILRAKDAYGTEIAPFVFDVESTGYAEVHFKANRFLPAQSRGILPSTAQAAPAAPAPAAPEVAHTRRVAEPDTMQEAASFCYVCGKPLPAQAMFCTDCGTPRYTAPPGGTPASPYTAAATMPLAETASSLPEYPMGAVWLAAALSGAWLLVFLLQFLVGRSIFYNADASYMILNGLLGAGIYLLLQKNTRYRLYGAGVFLIQGLLSSFNVAAVAANAMFAGDFSNFFTVYRFWPGLGNALVPIVLATGVALLLPYIRQDAPGKHQVYTTGWLAAGSVLLYSVIRTLATAIRPGLQAVSVLMMLFRNCADAAAIGFTVMLLWSLCHQESHSIRLSTWAKIWCGLCSVGMLVSLITVFTADFSYTIQIAFAIAALTGFVLLLCGRRVGFYTILTGAFIYLSGMMLNALEPVLHGVRSQAGVLVSAVIGTANPIITWFSIKKSWQGGEMAPPHTAVPQGKIVTTFGKVTTVINLIAGAFFFLLPFPFMIDSGFDPGMLASLIPGAVVTAFAIPAAVSLFGKSSPYRRWLDILMRVLFAVVCAILVIGMIGGILTAAR